MAMYHLVEFREWTSWIATLALPVVAFYLAPRIAEQITVSSRKAKHSSVVAELKKSLESSASEAVERKHSFKKDGYGVAVEDKVAQESREATEKVQKAVSNLVMAYRDMIPQLGDATVSHFLRYHTANDILSELNEKCAKQTSDWLAGEERAITQAVLHRHWDFLATEIQRVSDAICGK